MITNKVQVHAEICDNIKDLYKRKNADYGDSFAKSFQEWGLSMACIRLDDKLNRLKSFAKKQDMQVTDESVIDTLTDLANYAIMTIMELKEKEKK